ncbi:MAG: hypothetical protein LBR80_06270 [Deltaproteobacteria bacterium]|jgi:hypothetical protein|nr:hypothetical protein [Deltaproteobacteria bacterium]
MSAARRPRKEVKRRPPPGTTRDLVRHVHVTPAEYDFIEVLSALADMKTSHYIRSRCLVDPPLAAVEADAEDCRRLDALSERLNPYVKAANAARKAQLFGVDADHMPPVREAVALVAEFDRDEAWPEISLDPPEGSGGSGAPPRGESGLSAGDHARTAKVSADGFADSLGSFDAGEAKARALEILEGKTAQIVGIVSAGTSSRAFTAAANRSLATAYPGCGVRVTEGEVRKMLRRGGWEPAGDARGRGKGRPKGPQATRRVFLIVNARESEAFERNRAMALMGMASYVRCCAIEGPPTCCPPANNDAYMRLSRLSSNLTQLSFLAEEGSREMLLAARRRVGAFRLGLIGLRASWLR